VSPAEALELLGVRLAIMAAELEADHALALENGRAGSMEDLFSRWCREGVQVIEHMFD
jgi:hypothetical protein